MDTPATVSDVSFTQRREVARGVGIILVSSVLFGAMAVCVRAAAGAMPPTQIAFVRFLGSLLVLLALRKGRSLRPRRTMTPVLLRGILGAAAIVLYYRAIEGAGAGLATLLHCTYPIWTTVFAVTLIGERFNARLAGALALCALGVVVVLGPGAELSHAVLLGSACALASSVLGGGAVATARQLRLNETAWLVTTYFMAVGTAVTAPALLLALPPITVHLALLLAGVVLTSVAGQVLLHQGLGSAPAIQASMAAATSVVSATLFEALWLGELVGVQTVVGSCLLIAAVTLAASPRQMISAER